jgi:endonuclease YncB( thermonuclease family)
MHDRAAMALQPAVAGSARLDALPEVTAPPALETVEVSRVPDGATIESDGATLRLAGITAPAADECFGTRSTNQLIRLAGRSVLVERAPGIEGAVYAWTESGGERQLLNRRLLVDGYAGIDDVEGHPFAGWLTETEHQARYAQRGLWSSCTGPHGVERASGPERAGLEVEIEGDATPYAVWVAWPPTMVTTPDGGAWAFFSAATQPPEGDGDNRLYASRFDPATGEWTPGEPMPGGRVQFGATAVVDRAGRVHVVYSDRRADEERYPSRIVYVTEDGNGGWTEPEPVAPDDEAGYQLFPSLAIDDDGGLHVVWQDQRAWPEGDREAAAVNADIFASSLAPGGAWTEPAMLNTHRAGEVGNRPQIAADGDRLVVVWSIYTTNLGLNAAAYIEWSQRSRSDAEAEWSPPEVLIAGRGEAFGGRLLDLEADPTGGVVLVFGRRNIDTFLFLRRLEPGAERWSSDVLLTYGARGTFPSVAIDDRGTTYVAYHLGRGAWSTSASWRWRTGRWNQATSST